MDTEKHKKNVPAVGSVQEKSEPEWKEERLTERQLQKNITKNQSDIPTTKLGFEGHPGKAESGSRQPTTEKITMAGKVTKAREEKHVEEIEKQEGEILAKKGNEGLEGGQQLVEDELNDGREGEALEAIRNAWETPRGVGSRLRSGNEVGEDWSSKQTETSQEPSREKGQTTFETSMKWSPTKLTG